jgi:hypothetical protein
MALLMKESNEILSSVYRATPNLFQRFMPQVGGMPQLPNLQLQVPLLQTHLQQQSQQQNSPPNLRQHQSHSSLIQPPSATVTPPALSPAQTTELSIDQNCTPPSSSSSSNSTANSVSPLDFNSFVAAAAASTPVMSPLMMPTPKVLYTFSDNI